MKESHVMLLILQCSMFRFLFKQCLIGRLHCSFGLSPWSEFLYFCVQFPLVFCHITFSFYRIHKLNWSLETLFPTLKLHSFNDKLHINRSRYAFPSWFFLTLYFIRLQLLYKELFLYFVFLVMVLVLGLDMVSLWTSYIWNILFSPSSPDDADEKFSSCHKFLTLLKQLPHGMSPNELAPPASLWIQDHQAGLRGSLTSSVGHLCLKSFSSP